MTVYATLLDMLARWDEVDLVQLTDQAGAGVVDAARIDAALAEAAATIDAYVAVKYRTGQAPVPPLLTGICCTLARYRLFRDTPPDSVVADRKEAMGQLGAIAKGTLKLDAGEETLAPRPGAIVVDRRERIFGRDRMGGY